MKNSYKLPLGIQDWLSEDCYEKNFIENSILDCFSAHGFRKIESPSFEYYDNFSAGTGAVKPSQLCKFTDTDGNLLALRPDMTLPISRIVATKTDTKNQSKFSYLANSFSMHESINKDREFTQAGVEMVGGAQDYRTDAMLIALAIEALNASGLDDFLVDIGHVGFAGGIIQSLNLEDGLERELLALVDKKNVLGIELFARQNNISMSDEIRVLLKLPSLYGDAAVLADAEKFLKQLKKGLRGSRFVESEKAIAELTATYELLKGYGLEKYISFDLALVNGAGYYTGCVFSGMTRYFGAPIVGGGRYDTLTKTSEGALKGAGFAIGIKRLREALKKSKSLPGMPAVDIVIGAAAGEEIKAYEEAKHLRNLGLIVDNSNLLTKDDLLSYKKHVGAKNAMFFTKAGKKEEF